MRAAQRFACRLLVVAFAQWRLLSRANAEHLQRLQLGAAARLRNHVGALAFEAWRAFVDQQQCTLRRAAFILGPGREMALCFRTWQAKVSFQLTLRPSCGANDTDGCIAWQVREAIRARERQQTLDLLGSTLPDLLRSMLPGLAVTDRPDMSAMSHIASLEAEIAQLREQVSSAAQRQEAARRHTLNRIVRGWRHQHTSRAFDAWRELVQRHRELLVRSGRHWRNALVASVWRRWCTMVSEQREQRRAVASAAGRWRNRLAASAFLMWRDTVVATVERRRMLAGKVMGRWSNRLLASTFAPWLQLTVRSKHTKQLQGRAMMRMVHGLLSSVFWAWAEHAADAGERRQQLLVSNLPPSPHLLTESGVRKVSGMVLVRLARSLCSCLCPYPLLSYAHCLCPCRCPSMCLCHLLHRDGNLLVCLHVSIYVCSGRHGSRIGSSHVRYPWLSTHGGKPRTSAPTIESVSVIELSSASVTVSQRWRLRLGTNT